MGRVSKFLKIVYIFTYTCPNRLKVGASDSPDRFEHVSNPNYIREAPENNFKLEILMVRPRKLTKNSLFGVLKAFISNFLYHNLY